MLSRRPLLLPAGARSAPSNGSRGGGEGKGEGIGMGVGLALSTFHKVPSSHGLRE